MSTDVEHTKLVVADEAYRLLPEVPLTAVVETVPVPDSARESAHLGRYGKAGLRCAGALLAVGAPIAHGINSVANESPTHVPVHIAGADVTVDIQPGSNVANVTALGQRFTSYSHLKVGRKDIGYNIDADTTNITKADPNFTLNSETIKNILGRFTDLTAQKHEVMEAVKKHSEQEFAIGAGEVLGGELLAAGAVGFIFWRVKKFSPDSTKQAAVREFLINDMRPYALGVAGVALSVPMLHLGYSYATPNKPETVTADPAMAGTPLEGFEVNGVGKSALDTVVPNLRSFIANTNAYYANAELNFTKEFRAQYGTESLAKQPGVYRMIYADDLQGIPMGKLLGLAAHLYNADLIDAGGDVNGTETSEETDVADTLYDSAKGIPVVWVRGHHDDPNTVQIMKERGFTQADSSIQKVGPLTIYGVNDAETIDGLGLPAHEITPGVDNAQLTNKAIDYLCSDAVQKLAVKPIVIAHDNAIGTPIAETGCVPTVLTGREYFEQPPVNYGSVDGHQTTEFISGSTGGHGPNEGIHIFGTPKYDATFHMLDIDAKTQRILDYRLITVSSDQGATVTFGPTVKIDQIQSEKLAPQYQNRYQASDGKNRRQYEASRSLYRHQDIVHQHKKQLTDQR